MTSEAGGRQLAAVKHTRPGRQDRRVMSSEPVVELGGSFYLGERGVCGGGEPRGHETVPGEGGAFWLLYVFPWAGLDQGCLRNHSGAARDLKFEGKQAVLRIYGF